VTGGRLTGRRLASPRGREVRPTSDRVRESLFARLGSLDGCRVLDLYAGSGALGIEALSRGAARAVFVDRAASSTSCIRRNLEALELTGSARVFTSPVVPAVRRLGRQGERFELILMDPPYASEETEETLREVVRAGILAGQAMLVLETSRRHPPGDVEGLTRLDAREIGDTLVSRFEKKKGTDDP
jgi:16S rRNA (guanine(966)-N(2))-methyltransferase RsmD